MNKSLKIKILGAGPTGSLLAISLARIGCQVSIFDLKSSNDLIQMFIFSLY